MRVRSLVLRAFCAVMLVAILLPVAPLRAVAATLPQRGVPPATLPVRQESLPAKEATEQDLTLPLRQENTVLDGTPTATDDPSLVLPEGVSSDWWAAVQDDLRRSEYEVSWQDQTLLPGVSAAYQAPNRANGLRTFFMPTGIRVIPRTEPYDWELGLSVTGYGYQGNMRAADVVEPTVLDNQASYHRDGLVERYVNDEQGLRQEVIVNSSPAPSSGLPLELELSVQGSLSPRLTDDGSAVDFVARGGAHVLRSDGVRATDADGRLLPVQVTTHGSRMGVTIDTTTATYPVTMFQRITGLSTIPDWSVVETNPLNLSRNIARSVSTAGDVNADGYDDIIVGMPVYDKGQEDEGCAFVYYGHPWGLSYVPDWTAEGDQTDANFGTSVDTAGNVNQDNGVCPTCADIIVGAPGYANIDSNGRVFVYYGATTGLPSSADWIVQVDPNTDIHGSGFGISVGTAGDVNHDTFSDIIIGAPEGGENFGGVFVFYGSESGLGESAWASQADWIAYPDVQSSSPYFGFSVGSAGDVNGDGFDDVIIGAPLYWIDQTQTMGHVFVYYGSTNGLPGQDGRAHWSDADWIATNDQAGSDFGHSVSTAGNVNGDTYNQNPIDDVIIGTTANEVYVYYGSTSGLPVGQDGLAHPSEADWVAVSDSGDPQFGFSVSTAGDVNGDTYADVIIGAYQDNADVLEAAQEGKVFIYYGSATGLPGSTGVEDPAYPSDANWTATGANSYDHLGIAVDTAGDIAGDGTSDIIVNGQHFHNETDPVESARVSVYGDGFSYALFPDQCNSDSCDCSKSPACCTAHYQVGGAIDTFNGNHSYRVGDLSIPVLGGTLSFERTYSSQSTSAPTVLSAGWTHSYDMRLIFADDPTGETGFVIFKSSDGSRLRYYDYGNGTYQPYPSVQGTLTYQGLPPNDTYTLIDSSQSVYTFNHDGQLTSILDPQGYETTLSYENNLLHQVTSQGGQRYLHFTYDQDRLTEVADHTGRHVSFQYDQNGDLGSVVDVRGKTWTYSYLDLHLLYEVTDPNGHLEEKTDYDSQGRAVQQWSGPKSEPDLELEFTGENRVITDALGNVQVASYDVRNTWVGLSYGSDVTLLEGGSEGTITRSYDANFNLNYVEDANEHATEIEWNDCGCRPEWITDSLGLDTHMLYDSNTNNLISTTDALNHTTRYAYNSNNNMISTTNALHYTTYYTYGTSSPSPNLLIETKDPLGHHTYYRYNEYGDMIATAVVSGSMRLTTTYTYDGLGRLTSVTDPAGRVSATYYDGGGYVIRTVENCVAPASNCYEVSYNPADPDQNIITEYAYDGVGNRTQVTNTLGIVTYYEYDAENRAPCNSMG